VKKMRVVFHEGETDKRLLEASVKALESDVLKARFHFTIEHDDTAKTTTLWFWRRNGGANAAE